MENKEQPKTKHSTLDTLVNVGVGALWEWIWPGKSIANIVGRSMFYGFVGGPIFDKLVYKKPLRETYQTPTPIYDTAGMAAGQVAFRYRDYISSFSKLLFG